MIQRSRMRSESRHDAMPSTRRCGSRSRTTSRRDPAQPARQAQLVHARDVGRAADAGPVAGRRPRRPPRARGHRRGPRLLERDRHVGVREGLSVDRSSATTNRRVTTNPTVDGILTAQESYTWLAEAPFATIAAVRGYALGAGLQLALACDIRVVRARHQLGLLELQVRDHPRPRRHAAAAAPRGRGQGEGADLHRGADRRRRGVPHRAGRAARRRRGARGGRRRARGHDRGAAAARGPGREAGGQRRARRAVRARRAASSRPRPRPTASRSTTCGRRSRPSWSSRPPVYRGSSRSTRAVSVIASWAYPDRMTEPATQYRVRAAGPLVGTVRVSGMTKNAGSSSSRPRCSRPVSRRCATCTRSPTST